MSVTSVHKIFDRYNLATVTTFLPWLTAVGELISGTRKGSPMGLQEWFRKRQESEGVERKSMDTDLFWDNGILLAVPKKKVSHQKKRQKLYGPGSKQLKFIHHLNTCPACGHFKLANALCTHCVGQVSNIWRSQTIMPRIEPLHEQELSKLDERIIYPGKKDTEYVKKLKDKQSYLERHMRSLPVNKED